MEINIHFSAFWVIPIFIHYYLTWVILKSFITQLSFLDISNRRVQSSNNFSAIVISFFFSMQIKQGNMKLFFLSTFLFLLSYPNWHTKKIYKIISFFLSWPILISSSLSLSLSRAEISSSLTITKHTKHRNTALLISYLVHAMFLLTHFDHIVKRLEPMI